MFKFTKPINEVSFETELKRQIFILESQLTTLKNGGSDERDIVFNVLNHHTPEQRL